MVDEALIKSKLNHLFHDGEFDSYRVYVRKVRDRQPFFTANIVAILARCGICDTQLLSHIEEAKRGLTTYQKDHLAYHWPLIKGQSRVANSPFLGTFNCFSLSPDADCSCLVQMATQNNQIVDDIITELSYYRADNNNFILPLFQKTLPDIENTFLTWFPTKAKVRPGTLETIDMTVDANILWFLGVHGKLDTPGTNETVAFIKKALSTDIILEKTFELSPYYPFPLVILYHISRAIHWGKLSDLHNSIDQVIRLAKRIRPVTSFDHLLLAAIGTFFKNREMIEVNLLRFFELGIEDRPLYVGPLLFPLAQRYHSLLYLANKGYAQITFCSEAFQWALLLWVIQNM